MKLTKYLIIICLLSIIPINSIKAQNTNTMYFMNEIAERNNLNPAFTPSCNFYFDFIFLPNIYFGFGNDNFIIRDFIYNKNGTTQTFLNSHESLEHFFNNLQPTTTMNFNYNLNILSFGFQVKKSYFTFDLGLNMDIATYLPSDLLKFALYGTPDPNGINSFDFSQSGIDATLYSSAAFGYMYKINKQWTVGAKAKLLMGYANINTSIDKLNLNASRQEWSLETDGTINASLPLHFKTKENGSIDFSTLQMNSANELLELLYKPAGMGAAIDLGIKYEPIKNLVISASVTDLGFIYWSKNAISATMEGSHSIDELIDYTIGDTLPTQAIMDKFTGLGNEILSSMRTDGENKPYKSMIRGSFFVGAEYGVLKNKISLGIVNRLKFKNTHLQDEVTLALNLRPIHWFNATVSHSFINGRWGTLGLGLNLKMGIMNMFIIADYIPTSYAQIPLGDNALSVGGKTIISNVFIPNRAQMFNMQMGWSWNIGQHARDLDKDGVKRRKDKCPETDMDFLRKQCSGLKKKQYVDKHGCDKDDDKDGIHNCLDQCPETPAGVIVDSIGCPVDTDKDGVADYIDLCPETPQNIEVTEQGCPIDTDKDGIADYIDICPETPSNVLVDSLGCPIDSDQDGIADYLDICPETPLNVEVNTNGCPIDTDEDGIADYLDKCSDTPRGVAIDENGCPIDTDKDGIADYLDKCPNTQVGTTVDEQGCPRDSDGDGILDSEDKCPYNAGPISNYGCPELKKEVRNLFKKAMTGIQFESGKDIIKTISYPILDQIVAVLELNPEYHLTISGHTDNAGDDDKNMQLSIDRAAAVAKYIENKGIPTTRLTSQGFGETMPIADNKTSKGKAQNRRVEFEISFEQVTYEAIVNPELKEIATPQDSIQQ